MIQDYTAQTFTAWWIGAGIGFIVAVLTTQPNGWTPTCTITAVFTAVLFVIYVLHTAAGERALESVKGRLTRAKS